MGRLTQASVSGQDTRDNVQCIRSCWEATENLFSNLATQQGDVIDRYYDDGALIRNPIFGVLTGLEMKAAWRLIFTHDLQLSLQFSISFASETTTFVEWSARHLHPETGRPIAIDGSSHLKFKDGLIIFQTDTFSLSSWFTQALGWKGFVLSLVPGWRLFVQRETRHFFNLENGSAHE